MEASSAASRGYAENRRRRKDKDAAHDAMIAVHPLRTAWRRRLASGWCQWPPAVLYTAAMKRQLALLSLCCALAGGCAGAKIEKAVAETKDRCDTKTNLLLGPVIGEVKDLKDAKEDLEAQLKTQHELVAALRKSNKQLSESLQGSKGMLQGRIKDLVQEKDELSQKLDELKRAKIAVDRQKVGLEAKKTELKADLEAKIDSLSQQLDALQTANRRTEGERDARQAKAKAGLDALAGVLSEEAKAGSASLRQFGDTFQVVLGERILFEPKTAKLSEDGSSRLDRLGAAIARLENFDLRVEGHSDNAPIKAGLMGGFSNHWDLTSARAVAIVRYLHENGGINPRRILAAGGGEFHPLEANQTAEGRQANRRVTLVFSLSEDKASNSGR